MHQEAVLPLPGLVSGEMADYASKANQPTLTLTGLLAESRSAPFSTYTVPEVHMDTAGSTTDLATSTGSPTSRRVRERATSNSTTLAGLEDPRVFAPR